MKQSEKTYGLPWLMVHNSDTNHAYWNMVFRKSAINDAAYRNLRRTRQTEQVFQQDEIDG